MEKLIEDLDSRELEKQGPFSRSDVCCHIRLVIRRPDVCLLDGYSVSYKKRCSSALSFRDAPLEEQGERRYKETKKV